MAYAPSEDSDQPGHPPKSDQSSLSAWWKLGYYAVVWFIFSSILQIWSVKVQISQSISENPFDFEIMRVNCILWVLIRSCSWFDVHLWSISFKYPQQVFIKQLEKYQYFFLLNKVPSQRTYNIEQHLFNIDSTSRRWINVKSTLLQCCVPAEMYS